MKEIKRLLLVTAIKKTIAYNKKNEEYLPDSWESLDLEELDELKYEIDDLYDVLNEMRAGEEETNLESKEYSRHYDCHEVACKCGDKWIGWTYWYGGGKHGEPEAIDWMEDAYYVECEEKIETVTNRYFSK